MSTCLAPLMESLSRDLVGTCIHLCQMYTGEFFEPVTSSVPTPQSSDQCYPCPAVLLDETTVLPGEVLPINLPRPLPTTMVLFSRETARVGTQAQIVAKSTTSHLVLLQGLWLVERVEGAWRQLTLVRLMANAPYPRRSSLLPATHPAVSYCERRFAHMAPSLTEYLLSEAARDHLIHEPCEASRLLFLKETIEAPVRCAWCHARFYERAGDSGGGPSMAFVNPNGHVLLIALFRGTPPVGLRLLGHPSPRFSWFDGYQWTCVVCANCGAFVGWRFSRQHSPGFYGLLLNSMDLSVAQ